MMHFARRLSGFTLVEVVLCTSIVLTLAATPLYFVIRTESNRELLEARMTMAFEAGETLRIWRSDVARAIRIDSMEGGRRALLTLATAAGEEEVVYELRDGEILRVAPRQQDHIRSLAQGVEDLSFRQRGEAWEMSWNAVYADGARRVAWPRGGIAAPLIGGAEPSGAIR